MEEFLEMKTRIERLELEKNETRELREKYDRDVESIEDQWRKEVTSESILRKLLTCLLSLGR